MQIKTLVATIPTTLTKFLQDAGFSFIEIKKMLKNKDVKINNKRISRDTNLATNDIVNCYYAETKPHEIEKLYEDNRVIVALKPAGIETTGEHGVETILNAHAVHRLDRNTQGLCIFAKDLATKKLLETIFREKLVEKKYLCEVLGDTNFSGEIFRAYLFKDAKKSLVYISKDKTSGSIEIATQFKTMKHGSKTSIVECNLLTGKTHQIRAHLAFLGHPIIGDNKYGNKQTNRKFGEKIQKLFCYELSFLDINIPNISGKTFTKYPDWYRKKNS